MDNEPSNVSHRGNASYGLHSGTRTHIHAHVFLISKKRESRFESYAFRQDFLEVRMHNL